MIPKRIFFCWGWGDKLSWMRYMTLKSFRVLNPDWEILLFVIDHRATTKTWESLEEQDFFTYEGEDYFDRIYDLGITVVPWVGPILRVGGPAGPQHLSNFLKWWELWSGGGIYSDMDILWTQPVENFYNTVKEYNTVICRDKWWSIGLLGSTQHNAFFFDLHQNAVQYFSLQLYQCAGVKTLSRLGIKTERDIEERYPGNKVYNFGMNLVYRWDYNALAQIYETIVPVPDSTIGIHWYAGHPLSQAMNNKLCEGNYKEFPCTFTTAAGRIING